MRRVIQHYDTQTEDEAVQEDEMIIENSTQTLMQVPRELVPVIRELIAQYEILH